MKKWHKVLALLLAAALTLGLTACNSSAESRQSEQPSYEDDEEGREPKKTSHEDEGEYESKTRDSGSEKSLYEHGLDVVALIQKMAGSEEHIILSHYPSTGDDLISPLVSMNLSNPERLYQIKVTKDGYLKRTALIFELVGQEFPDDIPSDLWEMVEFPRVNTALLRHLYSVGGDLESYEIADYHADAFTATKIFVNHELAENVVYLYIFKDTAIAVAFNKGEGGAVLATGKPILIDEILNATPSDIERALTYGEGYSYVEVKDITP